MTRSVRETLRGGIMRTMSVGFWLALGMFGVGFSVLPVAHASPTDADLPRECGMSEADASYGRLHVGDLVRLGRHDAVDEDDDANWTPDMALFVGLEARVVTLVGVDQAGCPALRVDADGGRYAWRLRNISWLESSPLIDETEFEDELPPVEARLRVPAASRGAVRFTGHTAADVESSSFAPGCSGYTTRAPSFVFDSAAVEYSRWVVRADFDAVLLVRLPDGTITCSDDVDGLAPVLEGALPAGRIEVWIGQYGGDATPGEFTLAVGRDPNLRAGSLDEPSEDEAMRRGVLHEAGR